MAKKVIFVEREKVTDHYHAPEVKYIGKSTHTNTSRSSGSSGPSGDEMEGCLKVAVTFIGILAFIGLCIAFPPLLLIAGGWVLFWGICVAVNAACKW